MLCNLLRRKLAAAGLSLSAHRQLDELSGIREVTNLYDQAPTARRPIITHALSRMSDTQRKICQYLNLERYLTPDL